MTAAIQFVEHRAPSTQSPRAGPSALTSLTRWSACKGNVAVAAASMWRNARPLLVANLM